MNTQLETIFGDARANPDDIKPAAPKQPTSRARQVCMAVGHATGLSRITSASIGGDNDGATLIKVEFYATEEQVRAIGAHLQQDVSAGGAA